jgi:hypothetical protein
VVTLGGHICWLDMWQGNDGAQQRVHVL